VDGSTPEAAAVAEALEFAWQEVDFLTAIGKITNNSKRQAQASLLLGTLLLFRSQWEARQGHKPEADKAAAESGEALQLAAQSSVLPAELRALAEMRLAALAGPSNQAALTQHQEAALSIATAGKVWDVARVVRRDRAYWAKERLDWQSVWNLYRENIESSEREIWGARVLSDAANIEAQTQADYEGAVEACLELGKSDPAFYERALENAEKGKARAFLRGLATLATALSSVPPKLAERRNRILERMSDLSASAADEAETLALALRTVEEQIWAHPRTWALDMRCVPCSYEEMCALVPRDGAIVSYFTFADRLLIFVLGEHGLAGPPAEVRVPESLLARWKVELQLVIRLRGDYQSVDDIQRKVDMEVGALNAPLYLRKFHEALLQPVMPHLVGKRLIVVVPHGVLNGLPFHAFSDANGRALVEDTAVAYAAGLSVLRWCRALERNELKTCFAAGVCKLAGGPKCAEQEAAAVARAFGSNPVRATRDAVLQNAGDCDVIHLSCHSDMGRTYTAFSGLQLEDGPLRQREIAGMRCSSTLVTLSACETAEADTLVKSGAELAGLVGAFFRAGCPSVMASLWPVADAVAAPLAETFYAALKGGANKAEALRQAQLAVKAREGYDHPYFWAPFILWGNPS